jgi:hypothetical protein
MAGAGRLVPLGGVLYLYGAYKENGTQTPPSNGAVDRDFRRQNPEWGVRSLEEVTELARAYGLELVERISMSDNNLNLNLRL